MTTKLQAKGKGLDQCGKQFCGTARTVSFLPLPVDAPTVSRCACGGGCPSCLAKKMGMKLSSPGDPHERQAADVAKRAVAARSVNPEEVRPSGSVLTAQQQRTPAPPSVPNPVHSPGQPLPAATRSNMESRLGYGLANVRLHTDQEAGKSASELGANAYAVGNHVVMGEGRYNPGTTAGDELLAHELVHVIQQTAAPQLGENDERILSSGPVIQRDFALEPPHPEAEPNVVFTPEQMQAAIDANNRMIGGAGEDVVGEIRDILGIPTEPKVVDEAFVNAVLRWQAVQGITQDGRLGPRSAVSLFREVGAEGGRCQVADGPRYTPGGTFAAVADGAGNLNAHFRMFAEFESDPENLVFPSCCEVRQFIRWNAAAAANFAGGIPHGGFPAGHPADRSIEDRNGANTLRYGHRVGFSGGVNGNRYIDTTGATNQAFGHIFRGEDFPGGPAGVLAGGQWRFILKVIDVCNAGADVGTMDVIRINW